MSEKEGLQLVIELDSHEAEEFLSRAKTSDPDFYLGIAKSFVLGADRVVVPAQVREEIQLLLALRSYGAQGEGVKAPQLLADELSYTREQLQQEAVYSSIRAWSVYFGGNIQDLEGRLATPDVDQVQWFNMAAEAAQMITLLRDSIKKKVN